jgi:hypothetical protein
MRGRSPIMQCGVDHSAALGAVSDTGRITDRRLSAEIDAATTASRALQRVDRGTFAKIGCRDGR